MNELTPDEHGMLVDAIHDSATVIHKGQRMNERIIELMLEAGKTIPGDKHIDTDFCKKFAESIVRECMRMCEVTEMSFVTHECDVEASGAITVKQFIAEHFGVE
jgi:hypothetical protein